jgi:hypothetical protein
MRTARRLLEACAAALALAGLAWVWPATVTDLAAATLYPALAWLPTPVVLLGLPCCGCSGPVALVCWSCYLPVYARLIRFFPACLVVYLLGLLAGVLVVFSHFSVPDRYAARCLFVMFAGGVGTLVECRVRAAPKAAVLLWASTLVGTALFYLWLMALEVASGC